MGPPHISPRSSNVRYLTARIASAYFVAIPKSEATHIQNKDPSPPNAIAVATPVMLPIPIIPAKAVMSAWNWLISPSALSS